MAYALKAFIGVIDENNIGGEKHLEFLVHRDHADDSPGSGCGSQPQITGWKRASPHDSA
jgi:hypothetical protein